ncbi:hypothetical protein QOZ80_8AG0626020 [Eleusine coracana subsp. coracana]|nr:hypothetical protein QOZ80_8AG0626020 [Eleusine coracana subsp. coracana]
MTDNHKRERLEKALQDARVELIDLPVSLLEEITDDFSKDGLLGKGGFGNVYMGTLRNGLVAVKKISDVVVASEKSEDVVKRFCREFFCMMESKHKNIVRFLGYSFDVKFRKEGKSVERKMYICSEYVPNGCLHEYIKDESCILQWSTRYRIIRGVVNGVHYLHSTGPTIHKDLKPSNVVLDHNMDPKITDFGTSRRFDRGQSYSYTDGGIVSRGYTALELAQTGLFTTKSDIYSLGVIIMDLLVGHEKCMEFVRNGALGGDIFDTVLGTWKKVLVEGPVLKQVQVCAEMAVRCMDSDLTERTDRSPGLHYQRPERRPAVERPEAYEIVSRLREVENSWSALGQIKASSTRAELLDGYPRVLCFPLRKSHHSYLRETSCLLHLTNNTDHSVGFWIVPQFPKLYRFVSSCCGEVQPRETRVVNIILVERKHPPVDTGEFDILTVARSEKNSNIFMSVIGDGENAVELDKDVDLLKRIKELGEVHEAVLTAVIRPSRKPKVIRSMELESEVDSMDVHPTEPWILTYRKYESKLFIWNYQTQEMRELEIPKEGSKKFSWPWHSGRRQKEITSARFMAAPPGDGAQLIVMGDASGSIRTMTYGRGETKVNTIAAHFGPVTAMSSPDPTTGGNSWSVF